MVHQLPRPPHKRTGKVTTVEAITFPLWDLGNRLPPFDLAVFF